MPNTLDLRPQPGQAPPPAKRRISLPKFRLHRPHSRALLLSLIIGTLAVVGTTGAFIIWELHTDSFNVKLPAGFAKSMPFPIFVPKQLPAGYKVNANSFEYISSQQVVVFGATDAAGNAIAFTEQAKPATVNFAALYNKQFTNSSDLPDMPYPSTVGGTIDRQTTVLSIVTPTTWVLATTKAGLSDHDMQTIAQSIAAYPTQ